MSALAWLKNGNKKRFAVKNKVVHTYTNGELKTYTVSHASLRRLNKLSRQGKAELMWI